MGKINFDLPTQRRGTCSFKWDCNEQEFGNANALPMWVADMDFMCAPEITEAFQARLEHGIYGYTARDEKYTDALRAWYKSRHNWDIDKEHITFAPPGVIFGINVLIDFLTKPGDKILMQTPNYDSLMSSVTRSGRVIAENPMKVIDGKYELDFENMENVIDEKTKLLIMANPNNPTGRLWSREELTQLGDICRKHNIIIISDDIHCDIVSKGNTYTPIASISPQLSDCSIVCVAVNKTFNLGGLHMGTLIIGNNEIRKKYNEIMTKYQTRLDNLFGQIALETAYTKCGYWVDEVLEYIAENRKTLTNYIAKNLPQLKLYPAEGTYFAWIDFTGLNKGAGLMDFLVHECGVAFTNGAEFSDKTAQFMRVNLATQKATVLEAFDKINKHVNSK